MHVRGHSEPLKHLMSAFCLQGVPGGLPEAAGVHSVQEQAEPACQGLLGHSAAVKYRFLHTGFGFFEKEASQLASSSLGSSNPPVSTTTVTDYRHMPPYLA